MKIKLGEIRDLIREILGGSNPNEAYDKELEDDPSYNKRSVIVPNDIKRSIKKWSRSMGLSSAKRMRDK